MIIHTYIYTQTYTYIGATRDEIISAAKMANAHDFITAFPAGYDTQVRSDDGDGNNDNNYDDDDVWLRRITAMT
jgi:hypothetical protein